MKVESVRDVELVPGIELLEHRTDKSVLMLPSCYKVEVSRVGPWAFHFLDAREDLQDPGPFTITVRVLAKLQPPGVDQIVLYRPPEAMPDIDEHERGWLYWQQWKMHELERSRRRAKLDKLRNEVAYLNGITILDGPMSVEDDSWLSVIHEYGDMGDMTDVQRQLLFLQTQVINTVLTADVVRFFMRTEEITIEGLKHAFDSFRSKLERQTSV